MRSLALARYRMLTGVRSADWVFGISVLGAVVPLMGLTGLDDSELFGLLFINTAVPVHMGNAAATALVVAWFLHGLILLIAAEAFATVTNTWGEVVETSDLMDTVPIARGSRYLGEAAGILASLAVIHVCALPLLAFAGVMTPIGTPTILVFEVLTVLLMVFGSSASAWKMSTRRTLWARSRTLRAMGVMGLLLIFVLFLTTRLAAFRDAAVAFLGEPSPRAWAAVTASIDNPMLLIVLLFAVYAGSIANFYWQSIRPETRP